MKIIYSIPFLFLSFVLYGQTYLNKAYDINSLSNLSTSVIEIYNGNYLLAGQVIDSVKRAFTLTCISQNGDVLWIKQYGKDGYAYYTGSSGSLIKTSDGGYAMGGAITNLDDTINISDALLIKFDSSGDTLWTKIFGGSYFDAARICAQTADKGYILIGDTRTTPTSGTNDFLLIKTDSLGNLQWQKTYGGAGYDVAISGQVTLDGGYVLSGSTNSFGAGGSDHFIVKIDSAGNVEWQKTFGNSLDDGACYITQLMDSGYVLTGALDLGPGWQDNGAIRKINKNGSQLWLKTFGTSRMEWFDSRALELQNSDIVVAGSAFNASNKSMGWFFKINSNGDSLIDKKYIYSNMFNGFADSKFLNDNNFIICGDTWDGTQDAWVVKIDSLGCEVANCNISIDEKFGKKGGVFQVFPNPNNGIFTLSSGEQIISPATVMIFDVLGNVILEKKLREMDTEIDISSFPAGIYILKISTDDQVSYVKLVRE